MVENLKYAGWFLLAGALLIVGMRAAEWLIPKPETRILICFEDDVRLGNTCKRLDELREAKQQ